MELLHSITVPVSKIKSLEDVIQDPLVKQQLLFAKDPVTSQRITLAPPPIATSYLENSDGELSFPPRFGQHNNEIYAQGLGYGDKEIEDLKSKGII